MYNYIRTILNKVVITGLILSIPLQGVCADALPHKSALAPPLATKPPCQIIYDEKSGKCDVVTNYDVISSWDRETVKSFGEGVTASGQAFRNRWAFVDVSYLIGQMLILTQEHKLQNPKDILIPLLKKHIRNRNGEAEILLEGYHVDGIEEVREGEEIKGFSLPVTRNGTPVYWLIYRRQGGDIAIPMKDGKSIYIDIESFASIEAKAIKDDRAKALPSYTEETLKALEASGGHQTNAGAILGIKSSGVSLRIKAIRESGDTATIERLDKALSFSTEKTLEALEATGGNQAKASAILEKSPATVSRRIKAIRKSGDTATIERLDKVLSSLPSFTEKTLEALEATGGNQSKAGTILGKSPSAVSRRIKAIRESAAKIGDTATLERLNKALSSLPSFTEETLKDDQNITIDLQSERIHATNFRDTLTYTQAKENERARQAAEEPRPTIVALGTSWIKGYEKGRYLQHDALNPLVSSIRQFCKDQGIAFVDAKDEDLMAAITQVPGYTPNAKIIVLAGEETIKDEKYNDLVNEAENLFLAGVDSTKLTVDSYIRLMEMLTITMKLAHGLDMDLSKSNIPIEIRDGRYIFVPNAEPMDYEKYQFIYKLQTFA